jgi:uncharacterized membrane protein YeaQ/YmgE (transglycosylase-associated protein family)
MGVTDLVDTALDGLLSPALWLSLVMGLLVGVLFHILASGGWRWVWRDLLAAVIGFGVGQLTGGFLGNNRLLIGQVQVVPGILGAVVILLVNRIFLPVRQSRR